MEDVKEVLDDIKEAAEDGFEKAKHMSIDDVKEGLANVGDAIIDKAKEIDPMAVAKGIKDVKDTFEDGIDMV